MPPRQDRLVFAPVGIVDLGRVGAGGSNSHFLSINGHQHIAKCPSRSNGSWVCFNEFLAARLAARMGLPIPDFQVVPFQGPLPAPEQWFCSRRIMRGSNPVPATYTKLTNLEQLGGIALFDVWLCNTDRSPSNLWSERLSTDAEKLFMIDHGHTLLTSGALPSLAIQDISSFLRCSDLTDAITNVNMLGQGLNALTALPDGEIVDLIDDSPGPWIPDAAALPALKDFLLDRRGLLGAIIEANLGRFPKIQRSAP